MRMIKAVVLAQLMIPVAHGGEIIVTIKSAPEICAPLMVGVFDKESFLGVPIYKERAESAAGAVVRFSAVSAGAYAVSAYCDNNRNGELDKGIFGRPIEPIGMSRNAKGRMGPPCFEDAAVVVGADPVDISLTLR